MARPTERRKTQREGVNLQTERPVQLEVNRRFLQAGGYDKNVRAARALEQAFGVGARFAGDEMARRNAEGRALAVMERGAGQEARNDSTQAGYNRAWDELDAEYDFRLAEKELPELLRGFNKEERSEKEVQDFINAYNKQHFDGIQNMKDSPYAQYLAPRLLELETKHIAEHRDGVIERAHEEQRTKTYSNARDALVTARKEWAEARGRGEDVGDEPPPLDYQKLFERTGTFFDGAEKKTVFWESVYDLAIEMGDSSIIRNVPAQLPGKNGGMVPTGIDDPLLRPEHRAAERSADGVAAKRQSVAEAEQTRADKQAVFDLQLVIAEKALKGENVSREIAMLRANPEASFSDVTASVNFGQSQLDEGDSRSANLDATALLWDSIYKGEASLSDILQARTDELLGTGPQAVTLMKEMMATVQRVRESSNRGDGSVVSTYRSRLADDYNPARNGMAAPLDQTILHIKTQAMREYDRLVLEEGVDPARAARQVREEFDPMMDAYSSNAQSSSAFATEVGLISPARAKAFANGEIDFNNFARGQTVRTIEDSLAQMLERGDITDAEAERILSNIY